MRSAYTSLLWTVLLIASNGLGYLAGPKIEQLSGNGISPDQLVVLLLALGCTIGWMIALRRTAGKLSVRTSEDARIRLSLTGLLVGIGLILWAVGAAHGYQEAFHDLHKREMPTQYLFTYWSITWQLWAGLGCMALSAGIWSGEQR